MSELKTYIGKWAVNSGTAPFETGSTNVRNLSASGRKLRAQKKKEGLDAKVSKAVQRSMDYHKHKALNAAKYAKRKNRKLTD